MERLTVSARRTSRPTPQPAMLQPILPTTTPTTTPTTMTTIATVRGPIALPLLDIRIVPIERVRGNLYNPNHVAPHNMDLLAESIQSNGFCFAVVTVWNADDDVFDIVDGFHRYLIFRDYFQARELPIIVLAHDLTHR